MNKGEPISNNNFNIGNTENKKRLWMIASYVFIVLFIILVYIAYQVIVNYYVTISKPASPDQTDNFNLVRRLIDGVYVKPGEENIYPTAVVIENHPDARPPSGLARANLVFEAEAEGGITRFLAVFADGQSLEEIGPIRSARPYFIDWARELSALFIHCGGSPEALVKIARENIFNFNEFYQGDYFWRDKGRSSPHNIYISTKNINQYLDVKGASEGKFLSWQFKDDLALEERPVASEIKIGFKDPDFVVQWKYDRLKNDYLRYLAGQVHSDALGEEIRAKNIIIEYVKARVIDEELRLKMDHIGSGKAIICRDGMCQEGSWRKPTNSSRTRFYDNNSQEIKFNAGTTWIEVVRPEREVNF